MRLQIFVVGLCSQLLGPIERQIELATTVVQLTRFGGRVLVVVQQFAGSSVQGLGQNFGFGVVGFDAQLFHAHSQSQEFAE